MANDHDIDLFSVIFALFVVCCWLFLLLVGIFIVVQ